MQQHLRRDRQEQSVVSAAEGKDVHLPELLQGSRALPEDPAHRALGPEGGQQRSDVLRSERENRLRRNRKFGFVVHLERVLHSHHVPK